MEMRRIACWVLSVGVVVLLLAAPAVGRADIIHRYSFTNDAKDSVGGADGALMGNALVSGGQVFLDGSPGTYVDLSAIGNDIASLNNATVEAWVTWADPTPLWQRIFDFGQDTTTYMFLTPKSERNKTRFAISMNGGGNEQMVNSVAQLPDNVEMHVAVVIDSDHGMISLYINGAPSCTLFGTSLMPSQLGGVTPNNYLGKSQFNDPYFNGSINEFRIYNVALTASQIATSFTNGPDGTPP